VYDQAGDEKEDLPENTTDYGRFLGFGIPPAKNGDYAFLLHMIRSLKSKGKAAVILPHGVLFRGNAEAEIRKNLVRKGYIKGIVGLPPNLFFGTGIPACLIVIDKENAGNRKAIFMIDAGKGFAKDGPKNRLRDQDIHKIVDVFNKQLEIPKYSRVVPVSEIEDKDFNLNLPRYIDSQEEEDIQDIEAHLKGGIPHHDIEAMNAYWAVYPNLKKVLFGEDRPGYSRLLIDKADTKATIFAHPEFTSYSQKVMDVFAGWKQKTIPTLKSMDKGVKPKKLIHEIAENLLQDFGNLSLVDKYDVYQHLMAYWNETMQDDVFVISDDGWKSGSEVYRIVKTVKTAGDKTKQKEVEGMEGIESKLIKPDLIINRYFTREKEELEVLEAERENLKMQVEELEEEHSGEDGLMADAKNDKDKITLASVKDRLKRIRTVETGHSLSRSSSRSNHPTLSFDPISIAAEPDTPYGQDEQQILEQYIDLFEAQAELNKTIKTKQAKLETLVWDQYGILTEDEIKTLVVDDKWMTLMHTAIETEMQRISQRLTQRIKELGERYQTPLPLQLDEVKELEAKVNAHLAKMGFVWN
jgi:type I restriction enzyme M protein